MNVRTYFAVFAILAVLFGIGFILAPGAVLANYGITTTPAVAVMSRLFGGTLVAIAIIQWLARDFDPGTTRAVLMGVGVADAINCIIAIMATSAGTINALGWSTVAIYLVGALGAGYFLMYPDKR
jgi:hypothetical protein